MPDRRSLLAIPFALPLAVPPADAGAALPVRAPLPDPRTFVAAFRTAAWKASGQVLTGDRGMWRGRTVTLLSAAASLAAWRASLDGTTLTREAIVAAFPLGVRRQAMLDPAMQDMELRAALRDSILDVLPTLDDESRMPEPMFLGWQEYAGACANLVLDAMPLGDLPRPR